MAVGFEHEAKSRTDTIGSINFSVGFICRGQPVEQIVRESLAPGSIAVIGDAPHVPVVAIAQVEIIIDADGDAAGPFPLPLTACAFSLEEHTLRHGNRLLIQPRIARGTSRRDIQLPTLIAGWNIPVKKKLDICLPGFRPAGDSQICDFPALLALC
jgi:hypothetical protein